MVKDSKQVAKSHPGQLAGSARKRLKRHAKQLLEQELRDQGKNPIEIRQKNQQELNKLAQAASQVNFKRVLSPPAQRFYDSGYNDGY